MCLDPFSAGLTCVTVGPKGLQVLLCYNPPGFKNVQLLNYDNTLYWRLGLFLDGKIF